MISLTHRVEGGLWGHLVGDALGVPYEFHPASKIPPQSQIEMKPPAGFQCFHENVPSGSWSDDGAQTLCLLDSLLTQGTIDLDDFSKRLLAWEAKGLWAVNGHVFDVGNQTSDAFRALRSGTPPSQSGLVRPDGKGNGSLMRVLPLALWHDGTDEELVHDAHQQSLPTHGHITNQVCCALYCLWARQLLQGLPHDTAYQRAVTTLREIYGADSKYRHDLELTVRPDEPPETDGTGYVVSTLHAARLALQEATFEQVVRKAISYGEDTDTNAAVAGGLAGIVFGKEGIPQRWLRQMRGRDLVDPLLHKLVEHAHKKESTAGSEQTSVDSQPNRAFSELLERALRVATVAHEGQFRKGSSIPYITHPYAVGMILLRAGCDDEVVAAGILHDTVEDTDLTLDDIVLQFGHRVARLVAGASEPHKEAPWEERKQHTLDFLKTAPLDVRLVTCADKLHNVQALLQDYRSRGEELWSTFKRGKEQQLWYYAGISVALVHGLTEVPDVFREFQQSVQDLIGLADGGQQQTL